MGWNSVGNTVPQGSTPAAPFVPSKYQQAVFEWIETGAGHAVIEAVAGSGKSRTLIEGAKRIPIGKSAVFCAFNKSIVNELTTKLPRGITCKTINAIGHGALSRALGKLELDDRKYKRIARDIETDLGIEYRKAPESRKCVDSIISFAQSTLVDTSNNDELALMCEKFNIEIPEDRGASAQDFFAIARLALEQGIQVAREQQVISFNDQIWLPSILGAKPYGADYVFVDECQDLSRAKLELILMMSAERYLFVGDRRQSIYGFAGADPASFQNIIDRTEATVLPLSICYRCPKTHVELAQAIVPQIEAHENAIIGAVDNRTYENALKQAQQGDLIICRSTAPLVRMCIDFIKQRTPAHVKGRDIGESLAKLARDAAFRSNKPYVMFPEALAAYVAQQREKLSKRENSEGAIGALMDRADGVLACYDSFQDCRSVEDLCASIQTLFADEDNNITLSTIHRAKGLEAHTVFLLNPDVLPLTWENQAPWQFEQECNIEYVALTRAKQSLFFVALPKQQKG